MGRYWADSFAGNRPENSGKWNRYNLGGYFDVAFDVTEDFLINGTVRYEDYSDFGGATVWKLSSRYKFAEDKVPLEDLSTGFRALRYTKFIPKITILFRSWTRDSK
jgi:iron complex outermembrane receptor protein